MEYIKEPERIGEILKELFIVRKDGSVDHDMVIALARAAGSPIDPEENTE